jgi:hypothetical protein
MEKRSRRRIRDLVALPAYQGLSENENGCVRISILAKSMNALFTGRIQKRKTNPLHHSHPTCNTRPVHTQVPLGDKMRRDEKMGLTRSHRRHEPEASEGRRYQATVRLVG